MALCCGCSRFGMEAHYKFVRRLGFGGEGEVWLASPRGPAAAAPGAPRFVALKLLRRGLTKWQVEAVAAEVQCLLELGEGHCNIVTPTELLLSRTHLALVTEYVPGGSLADYLRRRSCGLPEQEASYFFRQIIAALQFCHARGIVYRDVKPENTLLSSSNPPTVSLCDFGVARRFGARPDKMTTLAGTPGFLAPQVLGCMFGAASGGAYDGAKADVWSSGALLSEMLLRRLPYDFDTFAANMGATSALRRLWDRAQSISWREAAAENGRPVKKLSVDALNLMDGMLEPNERARMSLEDVAVHPWVCQQLGAAHEAALAALAVKQQAVKRQARVSGVYCRVDGDGIIAALVSRASARAQHAPDVSDEEAPDCIRLRLEDVPRMQCPPSLLGVRKGASPPRRGGGSSPRGSGNVPGGRNGPQRVGAHVAPFGSSSAAVLSDSEVTPASLQSSQTFSPQSFSPQPQQCCLAGRRSRTLVIPAVDDGDVGTRKPPPSTHVMREEATV